MINYSMTWHRSVLIVPDGLGLRQSKHDLLTGMMGWLNIMDYGRSIVQTAHLSE